MYCKLILGMLLVLVTACAPADDPDPTPDATVIAAAVQATVQAGAAPPPQLIAPADGAHIDHASEVLLRWDWARPLLDDEVYDVRVWRPGEPNYGITWHRDDAFALTDWLAQHGPGEYQWQIAVLRVDADAGQVLANISQASPTRSFTVADTTLGPPDDLDFYLPPGFIAREYTPPLTTGPITVITFAPDGRLWVLTQGGDILALSDNDENAYAETQTPIYTDTGDWLDHAVGLAFRDDRVYISDGGRISTMRDADGDGQLDAETLNVLVDGLPSNDYPSHSNNGILFGADGKLYVGVGAQSDHGPVTREREAVVLRMNPDGSDVEVFARGLRNPYDLTMAPNGDLFTADNNPDQITPAMTFFAPEELNHLRQGHHYGFPDVFGATLVRDPATDITHTPPVTEFYPSVASAGLVYYAHDHFPPAYQDGIFVAQWGTVASTLLDRQIHNGRGVVFVDLEPTGDGTYTGDWEMFINARQDMDFRPVDVTVGPEGALYVANYATQRIYRVAYVGETAAQASLGRDDAAQPTPVAIASAAAQAGALLFQQSHGNAPACSTCHRLDGSSSSLGPSLLGLRAAPVDRLNGMLPADYVTQSIVDPNAYLVPGYAANIMYQDYASALSAEEIEALVAYVLSLG